MNPHAGPNFDEVFDRCRSGDQAAWSVLVDRFAGLVYAIARSHRLDVHACDDVAQSVFTSLSKNIGQIAHASALSAWLITTTKRECWRTLSRAAKVHAGGDLADRTDWQVPAESVLASLEQHQRIREALARLGERCQDLLRALFFETDRPDYAAIAGRLAIPIGSIGPTRRRCLAKLLELIQPETSDGPEPGPIE